MSADRTAADAAEPPAIPVTAVGRAGAAGLQLLPVTGLPEFRPGDDLAAAIAAAAPWLADGDVLLVTSKVVSKVEGRLVPSPTDPDERDALRRKLIDDETGPAGRPGRPDQDRREPARHRRRRRRHRRLQRARRRDRPAAGRSRRVGGRGCGPSSRAAGWTSG